MKSQNKSEIKVPLLFTLYFILLWCGQLSSAMAAQGSSVVNIFMIPLYFCFLSRAFVWFLILRKLDLIKAYTLSSINYLIIPVLSFFVLGEPFDMKHILGGIFIITGIIIYRMGEGKLKLITRDVSRS